MRRFSRLAAAASAGCCLIARFRPNRVQSPGIGRDFSFFGLCPVRATHVGPVPQAGRLGAQSANEEQLYRRYHRMDAPQEMVSRNASFQIEQIDKLALIVSLFNAL